MKVFINHIQPIVFFITVLIISQYRLYSQTVIQNNQYVYGKWTSEKSPYIINGEAIVPKGKTLELTPGVTLQFKTGDTINYRSEVFELGFLRVNGTIIAKGTEDNPVIFTRKGSTGMWGIIFLEETKTNNIFEHCRFQHSYRIENLINDMFFRGVISLYASNAHIAHNVFLHNRNSVFLSSYSDAQIRYNVMYDNEYNGIYCEENSSPHIINNTILNCRHAGICLIQNSNPVIVNNIIWGNKRAFYAILSNPKVSYSLIQENSLDYFIKDQGNNILGKKPDFVSLKNLDFSLSPGSPCIDSGLDGKDIGAIPFDEDATAIERKNLEKVEDLACGDTLVLPNLKFKMNKIIFMNMDAAEKDLKILLEYLKLHTRDNVELYGHTDYGTNQAELLALSRRRVLRVQRYLIEHGISSERIIIQYFGGKYPLIKSESLAKRAKNRRVEVKIICN